MFLTAEPYLRSRFCLILGKIPGKREEYQSWKLATFEGNKIRNEGFILFQVFLEKPNTLSLHHYCIAMVSESQMM